MPKDLMKYECLRCGWIYDPAEGDPDSGIKPGTPFKDIPNFFKSFPSYKMFKSVLQNVQIFLQNVQIHAKLIKSSLLHDVTFASFDYLCVMFFISSCRTS